MRVVGEELVEDLKLAAEFVGVDVPEFVAPDDTDILAGQMRFHLLDWGTRGRRPVLFMHGNGLTAHTWDLANLCLRQDFHCLAPDLRGHGDSEWSAAMEYGPDAHAQDIAALAGALDLDDFVLVGMSLGGMASILYAGDHADRLAALVIVDIAPGGGRPAAARPSGASAAARPSEAPAGGQREAPRRGSFLAPAAELDSVDAFVEQAMAMNPRRDPNLLRRSLLHNIRELPDGKWTWKYDRRHHGRPGMRGPADLNDRMQAAVPRISCPTLVVRGSDSPVLSDERAKQFADELPKGRWTRVEGAGHTVQGDNPNGFVEAVRSFLGEVAP